MTKISKLLWKKKGVIFKPNRALKWMNSHASLPIANHLNNNLFRIYFSTRDVSNRASVAFIEMDIKNMKILKISKCPVLRPGKVGTFDDNGVMAHSIVDFKKKKYMFYTGWNIRKTVPFHWSIGLAISHDRGMTFEKFSDGPILERNHIDPFFVASPTVDLEKGKWKMWYISGQWSKSKIPKISYNIRYADSADGINWKRKGIVAIDFKKNESRIGRASVLKEKTFYRMWYSYAQKNYKIGYAESTDGIKWKRKDELSGICKSKSGWDSKMIEYPYVFMHKSKKYMLYNGNNYGKTGFGIAVSD